MDEVASTALLIKAHTLLQNRTPRCSTCYFKRKDKRGSYEVLVVIIRYLNCFFYNRHSLRPDVPLEKCNCTTGGKCLVLGTPGLDRTY